MESNQFEAIIWAMLRIENEMDDIEKKLHSRELESSMEGYLKMMLEKNKTHFEAFKSMIERKGE
jgi:hypothetical protein